MKSYVIYINGEIYDIDRFENEEEAEIQAKFFAIDEYEKRKDPISYYSRADCEKELIQIYGETTPQEVNELYLFRREESLNYFVKPSINNQ